MPDKVEVPYDSLIRETLDAMTDKGILVVAQGRAGKPNPMTIGWGLIGSIWSQPIFMVLVRPSRYTHDLLEENGDFTVNVLPKEFSAALNHCGAVSGRDHDKFAEAKLTVERGGLVSAPGIAEASIVYECRTVMKNEVLPSRLDPTIAKSAYRANDFHTLYYGKILAVRADRRIAPRA